MEHKSRPLFGNGFLSMFAGAAFFTFILAALSSLKGQS
jgi:hypothetical protein